MWISAFLFVHFSLSSVLDSVLDPVLNVIQTCPCHPCPVNNNFIHISKTGGESIEKTLSLRKNHELGRSRTFGTKFAFSIIRNPYSRMLSWFRFCIHGWRNTLPHPHVVCNAAIASFKTHEDHQDSFQSWLREMSRMKPKVNKTILVDNKMNEFKYSQYDYLVDKDKEERLIPTFLVRYEHYEKDVDKLLSCLDRERDSQMVHENDSHNVSTSMRQDYKFSTLSDIIFFFLSKFTKIY